MHNVCIILFDLDLVKALLKNHLKAFNLPIFETDF